MRLYSLVEMAMHKSNTKRFIELDVLRGFAIVGMIFLHILWDLDYFGLVPLNMRIYQFQGTIPLLFFLLIGICLAVGWAKRDNMSIEKQKEFQQSLILRGLKIFSLGMIFTTITLIFMPGRPIVFGVLHFIGLSIILSVPFLKLKVHTVLFAVVLILAGIVLGGFVVENPTAIHLAIGLHQANVWKYTIDYFPLIPWFGFVLLGIALGSVLYCGNERRFNVPSFSKYKPVAVVSWLGRHSLAIYVLHQPVIAGALFVFIHL